MDENVVKEIKDALDATQVFAAVYHGKKGALTLAQEHAAKVRAMAQSAKDKEMEAAKRVYDIALTRAKSAFDIAAEQAQIPFNEAVREQESIVSVCQEELTKAEAELQAAQRDLKVKYGIDVGALSIGGGSTRL